jgi:hypothetical protein
MFGWWRKEEPNTSSTAPLKASAGTLNSTFPPKASAEVPRSSGELPNPIGKRKQRFGALGATEVTTDRTAMEGSVEELIIRTIELNWVLPEPLPAAQSFDQSVVRVWSRARSTSSPSTDGA